MVIEKYLHRPVTLRAEGEDTATGRNLLPPVISRRAARRMTHLGTLIARVLDSQSVDRETSLIYGSTYAETRSLEDYVDSFPRPSPLLFQGSIHPSAIQQVFVSTKFPVGEFVPLTGDRHLVASMLNIAFRSAADRAVLVGGEERGTWLLDHGLASPEAWAWSLELNSARNGAAGVVRLNAETDETKEDPIGHSLFFRTLAERRPMTVPNPGGGSFSISWQ
ncbi:MAG: hypothetical protein DRP71_08680 [Verrucomicrobia bacterium]|nr:MAG: hypothetical protein DRP71_08680 [Verrucomicrobiota bacterium]